MTTAIGQIQINGVNFAIVDPGSAGGYLNGIFARYLVVPFSIVDKNIEDIRAPAEEPSPEELPKIE
jgi:hypothetical protein